MDRRVALSLMSSAAVGTWAARHAGAADFPGALGVQLYTVRTQLGATLDATLGTLASIGYREVEALRPVMPALGPLLKKHGLTAPSGHLDPWLVTGNRDVWAKMGGAPADVTLDKVIEQAKRARHEVPGPRLPGSGERQSIDDYKRLVDKMNGARPRAARPASAVLPITTTRSSSRRSAANGRGTSFSVPPGRLAGRSRSRCLLAGDGRTRSRQDRARSRAASQAAPPEGSREGRARHLRREQGAGGSLQGSGRRRPIDFPGILRTARDLQVAHCFVEQDQTPGDPRRACARASRT